MTKLLASRLETVIPNVIHSDQTGFIKNRLGADNVRRLLHIINIAQKKKLSMFILSMDAEKAFGRTEPTFLFETLDNMGFGSRFTGYLKTIINSPKAPILTNHIMSNTFTLSRGCRQGCPISPLLFALAIEPLAVAVRSHHGIKGVGIGTNDHKISLLYMRTIC